MGRPQIHTSAAEKQRAYRQRQAAKCERLRDRVFLDWLGTQDADTIARVIIDQVGDDMATDIADAIERGLA